MTSSVVVRAARPEDLRALVRLCAAHAAYERAGYDPSGKADGLGTLLFGRPPRLFCVVAEHGRDLIGYATWSQEISTWDACLYAHMDCLYLDPEARGRGIGRRLVTHVAREALGTGCRLMQWQTPTFNTRAMRFYARLGATRKEKVRFFLDSRAMEGLAASADNSTAKQRSAS